MTWNTASDWKVKGTAGRAAEVRGIAVKLAGNAATRVLQRVWLPLPAWLGDPVPGRVRTRSDVARRARLPVVVPVELFAVNPKRVAILIPCHNEAVAIGHVVKAFRDNFVDADIYVYDNNSTDGTPAAALASGARVRLETQQGKGHVVRRMFADVEADTYVLVDGDDTYDAASAPAMVQLLHERQLDMVTGTRFSQETAAWRSGHRFGNRALSGLVRWLFGNSVSDILSGYRVFSRRFVKSFPGLASGFEIETEFTVHALTLRLPVGEIPTSYRERRAGSTSKLKTLGDGFRIFRFIVFLIKEEMPLQFFGLIASVFLLLGLGLGIPVVGQFVETGLVPRLPTAVLAVGLVLLGFLSLVCGFILDSVVRGRREQRRLAYLSIPIS